MANITPPATPNIERPKAGFNDYAERLNGRAAMLGFLLMVVIEYVTGEPLLTLIGLK